MGSKSEGRGTWRGVVCGNHLRAIGLQMRSIRPNARTIVAAALLVLVLVSSSASGERAQRGNLIVSLGGGLSPRSLPRGHAAPVVLRIGGRIRTADGSPLPRMTRIKLTLGGRGRLFTRGLPACPRARLRNADNRQALERCGAALVGQGHLYATAFVPHQAPFPIHGALLAFNGRGEEGQPTVWVHAYAGAPPLSIVLPFLVRRKAGALHTTLTATVPRSLGTLPHLAGFQLSLGRRYSYRGKPRSYLSASCPIPAGFTAGFLAFARATYSFADGRRLAVEAVRSCRTR
jgi:hypothetical protein